MDGQVAVVGAGVAGATLSAACSGVDVTLFERRDAVGGRVATREREGVRYEVGANYLTVDDEVDARLSEFCPDLGLEPVGPVWTFDAGGTVAPGDEDRDDRVTCPDGLAALPSTLVESSDATCHLETRIDALDRTDDRWHLRDAGGGEYGPFHAVVCTPPAPLTADLLGQSTWPHADCRTLREAIARVPYRAITSVVLHYPFEFEPSWYALVNEDREHALGWVAREDAKSGHVPDGESVLLVQCAPGWTVEHFDATPTSVADAVADLTADLLDEDRLANPDWYDHHTWRYAAPDAGADADALVCARDHDLYFAGDWVVGEDRLGGAIRSGLTAAESIEADLA